MPYGREYPVSKIEGNFLTITAAIAAAVADGFGPGSPAVVRVHPGTYTESFSMVSGIDVVGVDGFLGQLECTESVEIVGTITYATTTAGGISTEYVTLENVNVNPATGSAILFSGTNPQLMTCRNVSICAENGAVTDAAVEITNTGSGSRMVTYDCTIRQNDTTTDSRCVIVSSAAASGTEYWGRRTLFLRPTTVADATIIEASGGASGAVTVNLDDDCTVFGRLEFAATDQGGHSIRNTRFNLGAAECIIVSRGGIGGTGTVVVEKCVLGRGGTGLAIEVQGGGEAISTVLYYGDLVYESTGKGISALVEQGQFMSVPANRFPKPATAGGIAAQPNDFIQIDVIAVGTGSTVTLPPVASDSGSPPAAAALPGTIVEVKVVDESGSVPDGTPLPPGSPVTVSASGTDTIDGSTASFIFNAQGEFARFTVNDAGTGWLVSGVFEHNTGYIRSSREFEVNGGGAPVALPGSFNFRDVVYNPAAIEAASATFSPVARAIAMGPAPRPILVKRISMMGAFSAAPAVPIESLTVTVLSAATAGGAFAAVGSVAAVAVDFGTGVASDFTFSTPTIIPKGHRWSILVSGFTGTIPAGASFDFYWEAEFVNLGGA
jgi:hypothetical protein